jgi:hypothetical protein
MYQYCAWKCWLFFVREKISGYASCGNDDSSVRVTIQIRCGMQE